MGSPSSISQSDLTALGPSEMSDGMTLMSDVERQAAYSGGVRANGPRMPQMASCFAAGKIVLADVADKLSSQAFFNPYIIPLVNAMLNPSAYRRRDANPRRSSSFAPGTRALLVRRSCCSKPIARVVCA